jgi:hypothetical protein
MPICSFSGKAVTSYAQAAKIYKRTKRNAGSRTGNDLMPYKCQHCNGWHIGHDDGSRSGYDWKSQRVRERFNAD